MIFFSFFSLLLTFSLLVSLFIFMFGFAIDNLCVATFPQINSCFFYSFQPQIQFAVFIILILTNNISLLLFSFYVSEVNYYNNNKEKRHITFLMHSYYN